MKRMKHSKTLSFVWMTRLNKVERKKVEGKNVEGIKVNTK